jgi:hypothetical protein
MDFLRIVGQIALVVVGGAAALFAAIFIFSAMYASLWGPNSCAAYGEGAKLKVEWRFWHGCFVTMPDGRIMPESDARAVMKQEYRVDLKQR